MSHTLRAGASRWAGCTTQVNALRLAQTSRRLLCKLSVHKRDRSSHANVHEVQVRHSAFELHVDFNAKVVDGYVRLDAVVQQPNAGSLILDCSGLTIHSSELCLLRSNLPLAHKHVRANKILGNPLCITLPQGLKQGQEISIGIRFTTSKGASALQFLDPSQTAGGRHPFLFTHCYAIHTRSFVPCQDSPLAKMTYSAAVRAPAQLSAVMSALATGNTLSDVADLVHVPDPSPELPKRLFFFNQPVPIAPYLLALAVGDLESRKLSDRSAVWSEPSVVEAAAYEFADTAKLLETAISSSTRPLPAFL